MDSFDPATVTTLVGALALFGWLAIWSDMAGWRRRRARQGKTSRQPWWLWAARFIVIASAVFALSALYIANRDIF